MDRRADPWDRKIYVEWALILENRDKVRRQAILGAAGFPVKLAKVTLTTFIKRLPLLIPDRDTPFRVDIA